MEREILFRGKNFVGEWVYGSLITLDNGRKYVVPNNYFELDGYHLRCYSDYPVFVDENTIGQYVGMDCGEHRIFDGDLLSWSDEEHLYGYVISRSEGVYEVKWREEYLRFDLYDNFTNEWWELNDTEFDDIVGNICDNYSELLKG